MVSAWGLIYQAGNKLKANLDYLRDIVGFKYGNFYCTCLGAGKIPEERGHLFSPGFFSVKGHR